MKRFFTCLLAVLTLLSLTPAAYADVLWEPDNNFYEKHSDECVYVGRSYYANGPKGFVTLWDAPDGSTVAAQYENGVTLHVTWQYQDWGCVESWKDGWEGSGSIPAGGWVPMSELYLVYDYISFEEEYGQYFTDYNGEFAEYDGQTWDGVQVYDYPIQAYEYPFDCRGIYESIEQTPEVLDALRGTPDTPSCISKVFREENGTVWGFVSYLYGHRNFWFDLTNPTRDGWMLCMTQGTAEDLIDSGELTAPQTPVMPSASRTPYFLVGGAVVVTLGLLGWFYGRKRSKK